MPVRINGATSGSTTITAPNTGGDETIELSTALAGKVAYPSGGSNGHVLTKSNTAATWTPPPVDKVIQIVTGTLSTATSRSANLTFTDTGLSATITPTSASSKILVIVHQTGLFKTSADILTFVRLVRDSTAICNFEFAAAGNGASTANYVGGSGTVFLDSPATTSATTYKTQYASNVAAGTIGVSMNNSVSTICLMEVTP